MKYPDTSKPYMLYTDASKYGWAGVLTQEAYIHSKWQRNNNWSIQFLTSVDYFMEAN